MKNSSKKKFPQNNLKLISRKRQFFLSKININQKPTLKKYLTQFFESPKKFFVSKYSNKEIIINKLKSPSEFYEIPIPHHLLKYLKRRKTKVAQEIIHPEIKEEMQKLVSKYSRGNSKKIREISETKKDKDDKKEII